MRFLITAGNTRAMIDRVRCLTNIFTGRTGAALARAACGRGHRVTLLTSHPDTIDADERLDVHVYHTFEELRELMEGHIAHAKQDVVIHCAAVSDYLAAGVYAPQLNTRFDENEAAWEAPGRAKLSPRQAGKIKSDDAELWLRLVRAPKLVDMIRADWRFAGVLVKFKLEVGVSDEQLIESAERSRRQSQADLMVANTLEGAASWAYLGPFAKGYEKIERQRLPEALMDASEAKAKEAGHG